MSYSALAIKSPIALGVLNLRRHDGHNDGNGCDMMLKLTFILSSLSMEPIAAGMPQTFRASTRILPTGRFDNLLLMSAVYSLFRITSVSSNNKNPIIGMSERLNGVNWTRTPLARTSGPHMTNDMSLDSFVFISNSCKRMYARHHQLSWHALEGRPFSHNGWPCHSVSNVFDFRKFWGAVEQVLMYKKLSFYYV